MLCSTRKKRRSLVGGCPSPIGAPAGWGRLRGCRPLPAPARALAIVPVLVGLLGGNVRDLAAAEPDAADAEVHAEVAAPPTAVSEVAAPSTAVSEATAALAEAIRSTAEADGAMRNAIATLRAAPQHAVRDPFEPDAEYLLRRTATLRAIVQLRDQLIGPARAHLDHLSDQRVLTRSIELRPEVEAYDASAGRWPLHVQHLGGQRESLDFALAIEPEAARALHQKRDSAAWDGVLMVGPDPIADIPLHLAGVRLAEPLDGQEVGHLTAHLFQIPFSRLDPVYLAPGPMAFTEDGRFLLIVVKRPEVGKLDRVLVLDAASGQVVREVREFEGTSKLVPTGGSSFLLRADGSIRADRPGVVAVIDAETGTVERRLELAGIVDLAVGPAREYVVGAAADGTVRLLRWPGGEPVATYPVGSPVWSVEWMHDGRHIVLAGPEGAHMLDLVDGVVGAALAGRTEVSRVETSSDGLVLLQGRTGWNLVEPVRRQVQAGGVGQASLAGRRDLLLEQNGSALRIALPRSGLPQFGASDWGLAIAEAVLSEDGRHAAIWFADGALVVTRTGVPADRSKREILVLGGSDSVPSVEVAERPIPLPPRGPDPFSGDWTTWEGMVKTQDEPIWGLATDLLRCGDAPCIEASPDAPPSFWTLLGPVDGEVCAARSTTASSWLLGSRADGSFGPIRPVAAEESDPNVLMDSISLAPLRILAPCTTDAAGFAFAIPHADEDVVRPLRVTVINGAADTEVWKGVSAAALFADPAAGWSQVQGWRLSSEDEVVADVLVGFDEYSPGARNCDILVLDRSSAEVLSSRCTVGVRGWQDGERTVIELPGCRNESDDCGSPFLVFARGP